MICPAYNDFQVPTSMYREMDTRDLRVVLSEILLSYLTAL